MINQKTRDEILLYWSGEADAAQEAKVQVLLESDPEARDYFEELGVFDALRDRLASLPAMTPSLSFAEGAVSEILAERSSRRAIAPWVFCGCGRDRHSCGSQNGVALE
jgi:anti-sigma factor RsiW